MFDLMEGIQHRSVLDDLWLGGETLLCVVVVGGIIAFWLKRQPVGFQSYKEFMIEETPQADIDQIVGQYDAEMEVFWHAWNKARGDKTNA